MLIARFWPAHGLTGNVIAWVEGHLEQDRLAGAPLASHVSLERVWTDEWGAHWDGIEAVPPRVHHYDPHRVPQATRAYVSPAIDPYRNRFSLARVRAEGRVWAAMERHVGDLYNVPGLLAVGLYCLTGHQEQFFNDPDAYVFCSMAFTEALRAGGIEPFPDGRISENVTPAALETALIALGWIPLEKSPCAHP